MAFKPITLNTPEAESAHILAEDDAAFYEGFIGGDCVLPIGNKFSATVQSNNKIRISDGVAVVGGHVGRIVKGDYEDMTIENGASGVNRNDIIALRFIAGSDGGADSYDPVVIKGTATAETASDPELIKGDLYAGDKQRDFPLWRVKIEGLSIVAVEQMFELGTTNADLSDKFTELNGKLTEPRQMLSRDITVADISKSVTLLDNLSNYKTIEIRYTFNAYGHYVQSMRMPILAGYGWSDEDSCLNALINPANGWEIIFTFAQPNLIKIHQNSIDANWAIKGIYGYKY